MDKYVKKPIPVSAFQWDGKLKTLIKNINYQHVPCFFKYDHKSKQLFVNTMEGMEKCHVGDYVICGVDHEFYVCNQKIFKKTYQKVSKTSERK